ncbi:MAG: phosphatase PAP2 family protein [Lachnospiraceae bacterium]|jgi:membrane-associated phospholipid phosphatase
MNKLKNYSHAWIILVYGIFYMISFAALEKRSLGQIYIIRLTADDKIPFCEYFIIPYLLWFAFIAVTLFFFTFINKDKREFYQLICSLGIGMTLFLLISFFFPNGQTLRPVVFPRENIFTSLVRHLYRIDTPTNIFPSIHVFNTVTCYIAIVSNKVLQKHKGIIAGTSLLSILIILSTVFLKQHTLLDVIGAFVLNIVCYQLLYKTEPVPHTVRRRVKQKA